MEYSICAVDTSEIDGKNYKISPSYMAYRIGAKIETVEFASHIRWILKCDQELQ